jgi:hypothetical protein
MNYEHRITPIVVKELKDNEVFVFGSNEAGRHSLGAAKTAMLFGAKYGRGKGIQGNAYAIPTKDKTVKTSLTLVRIKKYVQEFLEYAKAHTENLFLVTAIGCGLAGYKEEDIAPMFEEAKEIENIFLPVSFWKVLTTGE